MGFGVAAAVFRDFAFPEFDVRSGKAAFAAVMAMPKASVDEDGGGVLGEHDVGLSGKVFAMESEAEAQAMEKFAEANFRFGVLGADFGHDFAALGGIEDVCQSPAPGRMPVRSTRPAWIPS